jgi:hypothetical protein
MQAAHRSSSRTERSDLDRRYGQIGISAVAAAVRYQGEARNPVHAPPARKPDQDADEDTPQS